MFLHHPPPPVSLLIKFLVPARAVWTRSVLSGMASLVANLATTWRALINITPRPVCADGVKNAGTH